MTIWHSWAACPRQKLLPLVGRRGPARARHGLPTLRAVFDEQYYTSLPGGILEGLGRLFQGYVRLYVYPTLDQAGEVASSTTLEVAPPLQHLLNYLREKGGIEAIEDFDSSQLHMFPKEVLTAIQNGTPGWEQYLPPQAAEVIKQRALFGYRQTAAEG